MSQEGAVNKTVKLTPVLYFRMISTAVFRLSVIRKTIFILLFYSFILCYLFIYLFF